MPKHTLILLRHAKSDWRAGAADDHARPLNARGQRAAALIGVYLSQRGLAPDLVLTSSAVRARQTAERVLHHAGLAVTPTIERALYLAEPERILSVIRERGDESPCLMCIGHNPGMQALVALLAQQADADVRETARGEFVTAAIAVGVTDARWRDASPETIQLLEVTAPKALV